MEDTLKGLRHLHYDAPHPMLHRDFKAENLLVFTTGDAQNPYRVKLGDLGLSKLLSKSRSFATAGGTPFTMAPEVLGGRYRASSDMFSWGITMCFVIVKAMGGVIDPYSRYGDDRAGMVARAVELVDSHRPSLARLLRSCCNVDYMARPTSREALEIVQATEGPGPSRMYDVVGIVRALEAQAIDASKVIDALGGMTMSALDPVRSLGVSIRVVMAAKRVLDSDGSTRGPANNTQVTTCDSLDAPGAHVVRLSTTCGS